MPRRFLMMEVGKVIKKYRKEKGMTQEDMAGRLGVTAPAVNKWENGNSMPDIMLLAPIARLLDISLDTLLSFKEELTELELQALLQEAASRLKTEDYEEVFQWGKRQMEQYPNCERLILYLAVTLDAYLLGKELEGKEAYSDFFRGCYERLLDSREEAVRTTAADSLYNYFIRKEQFGKAEEYLAYISQQNPERKRKQAFLYGKQGRREEAYKAYEELLFSGYQMQNLVLHHMFSMSVEDGEMDKARFFAEKRQRLIALFDIGEYAEYTSRLELAQAERDVEGTLECARHMLGSIGTVSDFCSSPLYGHMTFKEIRPEFYEEMKGNLLRCFLEDESFGYMGGNQEWEALLEAYIG